MFNIAVDSGQQDKHICDALSQNQAEPGESNNEQLLKIEAYLDFRQNSFYIINAHFHIKEYNSAVVLITYWSISSNFE